MLHYHILRIPLVFDLDGIQESLCELDLEPCFFGYHDQRLSSLIDNTFLIQLFMLSAQNTFFSYQPWILIMDLFFYSVQPFELHEQ